MEMMGSGNRDTPVCTRIEAVILMAVLICGGLVAATVVDRSRQLESLEDETPVVLDFTVEDVDGGLLNLSDLRGKPVLVDLMATWCGPCRVQIGLLKDLEEEYGEKIQILSIGIDRLETVEDLREFDENLEIGWPVGYDHAGEVYGALFPKGLPTLVLIDEKGRLLESHTGSMDRDGLEDFLGPVI